MSNYFGYKIEDNARRKSNNTGDELGWGQNNNVKSYSSKPGQKSMKSQARILADKQQRLNKKQPIISMKDLVCPLERIWFLKQRGLA